MMKRVLCGAMAAALVASTLVVAPDASAASVPKAKYTFNMNKKSSKVVAVQRPGDTANFTCKNPDTGVLPKATKKIKLKYVKGKHGKALYLDRSKSYGAELKGIKLGSKSWTMSFWVKASSSVGQFMPVFYTGNNIVNVKKTNWLSITRSGDDWLGGGGSVSTPTVWSRNAAKDQFPWYAYQNEEGVWQGSNDAADAVAIKPGKWVYITLVIDSKDTCPYGEEGGDGYMKGYHAWTYVNGKLFGNGTVADGIMSNKNKFYLGINAWDCPFKGYFDDVQFWKKALTDKQVAKLYKKMK